MILKLDDICKTCGHSRENHKGTAMICMKQTGQSPGMICDCCYFDDGKPHELPIDQGWKQDVQEAKQN